MTQCLRISLGDKRDGTACTSLPFLRGKHAFGRIANLLHADSAFKSVVQQSACVTALRNFCALMQFRWEDTTVAQLTQRTV